MILAVAAIASIVLADPQRNYGFPNPWPVATPSRLQLIRPATFIRPFRNPAVPPRVFGGSGRFARQISIEDLFERLRNPTEAFRGISAIAEKIPGISNLPIARIRNATANIPRLSAIFGSLPDISNLPNFG